MIMKTYRVLMSNQEAVVLCLDIYGVKRVNSIPLLQSKRVTVSRRDGACFFSVSKRARQCVKVQFAHQFAHEPLGALFVITKDHAAPRGCV